MKEDEESQTPLILYCYMCVSVKIKNIDYYSFVRMTISLYKNIPLSYNYIENNSVMKRAIIIKHWQLLTVPRQLIETDQTTKQKLFLLLSYMILHNYCFTLFVDGKHNVKTKLVN